MDFADIQMSPGELIDRTSPTAQGVLSCIDRVIDYISRKLKEISSAKTTDFKFEEYSLHKNDHFPGSMVVSMTRGKGSITDLEYMCENYRDYLVCLKSDGVRYLLAVLNDGKMIFVDRNLKLFEVKTNIKGEVLAELETNKIEIVHLFDGELIRGLSGSHHLHFQIFDTIVYSRSMIVGYDYLKRLKISIDFVNEFSHFSEFLKKNSSKVKNIDTLDSSEHEILVITKDFYKIRDLPFVLESLAKLPLYLEKIDGLIFTKINYPYVPGQNKGLLKWKPGHLNSIDFLAIENKQLIADYNISLVEGIHVFELYVLKQTRLFLFDYMFVVDTDKYDTIKKSMKDLVVFDKKMHGAIIEANYDKDYEDDKFALFWKTFYDIDLDRIRELITKSMLTSEFSTDITVCHNLLKSLDRRTNLVENKVNGNWNFLRPRIDKCLPNGFNTAKNVLSSIFEECISQEDLLKSIKQKLKIHNV